MSTSSCVLHVIASAPPTPAFHVSSVLTRKSKRSLSRAASTSGEPLSTHESDAMTTRSASLVTVARTNGDTSSGRPGTPKRRGGTTSANSSGAAVRASEPCSGSWMLQYWSTGSRM